MTLHKLHTRGYAWCMHYMCSIYPYAIGVHTHTRIKWQRCESHGWQTCMRHCHFQSCACRQREAELLVRSMCVEHGCMCFGSCILITFALNTYESERATRLAICLRRRCANVHSFGEVHALLLSFILYNRHMCFCLRHAHIKQITWSKQSSAETQSKRELVS